MIQDLFNFFIAHHSPDLVSLNTTDLHTQSPTVAHTSTSLEVKSEPNTICITDKPNSTISAKV